MAYDRGHRAMDTSDGWTRGLSAAGAVLAACAVGLAAYASHAAAPGNTKRLALASAIAFGHGLALVALAPAWAGRPVARWALALMLVGTLVFAGTLVAAALFGTSTAAAPSGGMALIVAWLLVAAAVGKR